MARAMTVGRTMPKMACIHALMMDPIVPKKPSVGFGSQGWQWVRIVAVAVVFSIGWSILRLLCGYTDYHTMCW
jgi:hypothetical protein